MPNKVYLCYGQLVTRELARHAHVVYQLQGRGSHCQSTFDNNTDWMMITCENNSATFSLSRHSYCISFFYAHVFEIVLSALDAWMHGYLHVISGRRGARHFWRGCINFCFVNNLKFRKISGRLHGLAGVQPTRHANNASCRKNWGIHPSKHTPWKWWDGKTKNYEMLFHLGPMMRRFVSTQLHLIYPNSFKWY